MSVSLAELAIVALVAALLVFGGLVYRMNREDDARELEAMRRRLRARARKERADS